MAVAPRPNPLIRVSSSDGVSVAVHDLAGAHELPTLLVSHATGFHAHCYLPIAAELSDRYHAVGLDYRGHGETEIDPTWETDWSRFGDDAIAVARQLSGPITGFGHSMGGAALLMAARRDPSLFDRLVLFEPIAPGAIPSSDDADERPDIDENPMVQAALRRRRSFPSFDAAFDNYRGKPPMSLMTPEVLRNYVEHGFRPAVDDDGAPVVTLRCTPEVEAGIFASAVDNGVWELLPHVETPCVVISGQVAASEPSAMTRAIADRLPRAEYVQLDHQTHFGPFSHPHELTELIAR